MPHSLEEAEAHSSLSADCPSGNMVSPHVQCSGFLSSFLVVLFTLHEKDVLLGRVIGVMGHFFIAHLVIMVNQGCIA